MRQLLLKACVAGACAFAFVASYGPAKAVSPVPLKEAGSSAILIADDQENLSVEEDLRPDEPPSDFEAGAPDKMEDAAPPQEEVEGEGSGNIEDKMLDEIGPGAE